MPIFTELCLILFSHITSYLDIHENQCTCMHRSYKAVIIEIREMQIKAFSHSYSWTAFSIEVKASMTQFPHLCIFVNCHCKFFPFDAVQELYLCKDEE